MASVCGLRIADGIIGSDRSLKPRERVLTALAHKEPDRVPIDLGGTVASGIHVLAHERLTKSMGLPWKGTTTIDMIQQLASPAEELLCNFGSDFRTVSMKLPKAREIREYTSDSGRPCFVDEWGVKWGKNPYYYDMIDHPLKKPTT
jgi:uroporphyrinogen decarboxylase